MRMAGGRVSARSLPSGRWFALLALCLAGQAPAGDDLAAALAASRGFGFAKIMYVADDRKGGRPDQGTLGAGGKLGGETGDFHGLALRGAWYLTSDLGLRHGDPRRTDAYMFDLDKTPYSLLGEAQLRYRVGNSTFTLGRQEFFSPIINTYEYRIIPNLFQGATLVNRDIPHTTLTLAHINEMSGLDGLVTYSEFRSMSQQTYTSLKVGADGRLDAANGDTLDPSTVVGHHGVWVAGGVYEQVHRLQFWNFHGTDTLNTVYLDGRWNLDLTPSYRATLEGQAYRVDGVGRFKAHLARQGLNARYGLYGLKGTLAHAPSGVSLSLAYNRFTGGRDTVTAFGNWGGYPEFVGMPYLYAERQGASAIANSRLARATLRFDLARLGVPGHSLLLGHSEIDIDADILPRSDIRLDTLLYRAQFTSKLSARVAVEARHSRNARYDNDFITVGVRYDF